MTGVLVDTNVLIYAYDGRDPQKQMRAIAVLERLGGRNGRLSSQVVAEFFNASRRGARPLLSEEEAAGRVAAFLRTWPVLPVTSEAVREAVRGVRQYRLGYWDAQLWATARLNRWPAIISEDFSDGQVLEGVRFVNPFAPGFQLSEWE